MKIKRKKISNQNLKIIFNIGKNNQKEEQIKVTHNYLIVNQQLHSMKQEKIK